MHKPITVEVLDDGTITKRCNKCDQMIPATNKYFSLMKKGKFGLNSVCKLCRVKYREGYNALGGKRYLTHCEVCGADIITNPSQHHRFCSRKCVGVYNGKNMLGENSHRWKTKTIKACENCGKEMELIPALVGRKKFCSRQCLGVWIYEKHGVMTEPERIMDYVLKSHGIICETHKTIGKYNVDFSITNTNIVIEVDGYYWHILKAHKTSDPIKEKVLTEQGYNLVRLPEKEIYSDIKGCIDKIKKEMSK